MNFTGYNLHPRRRLSTLVKNVLPHLSALSSIHLGQDIGLGLMNWYITTIQSSLHYLHVSMEDIPQLCHVISRETLSTTLEQLYVTMRSLQMRKINNGWARNNCTVLIFKIYLSLIKLSQDAFYENIEREILYNVIYFIYRI